MSTALQDRIRVQRAVLRCRQADVTKARRRVEKLAPGTAQHRVAQACLALEESIERVVREELEQLEDLEAEEAPEERDELAEWLRVAWDLRVAAGEHPGRWQEGDAF